MAEEKGKADGAKGAARFLGSLREALAAAGREETPAAVAPAMMAAGAPARPPAALPAPAPAAGMPASEPAAAAAAAPAEAATARPAEPRAAAPAPRAERKAEREPDSADPPTTRVVRAAGKPAARPSERGGEPRTELLRGRNPVKRGKFHQDPVVGWLVVVGGLGLGAFRPIYEGNNTVGRAPTQRIPIDFGDDAISAEEQAYIRYDSAERSFLFVPNLAKTNVVSVNDKKPTGAVPLSAMDVITMGRTQLVFMPFCGPDFDWSELTET